MRTQHKRTYVVYRSTWGKRPYAAIGTVVAPTRSKAIEIARRRWRVDRFDETVHVRAAGSVSLDLLLYALIRDGA